MSTHDITLKMSTINRLLTHDITLKMSTINRVIRKAVIDDYVLQMIMYYIVLRDQILERQKIWGIKGVYHKRKYYSNIKDSNIKDSNIGGDRDHDSNINDSNILSHFDPYI